MHSERTHQLLLEALMETNSFMSEHLTRLCTMTAKIRGMIDENETLIDSIAMPPEEVRHTEDH